MKRRTETIIRCLYVAVILYGIALVVGQLVALRRPTSAEACRQALTIVDSGKDKSANEAGNTQKAREKK